MIIVKDVSKLFVNIFGIPVKAGIVCILRDLITWTLATSDSSHLFIKSCKPNDLADFINVKTNESFSFVSFSERLSFRNLTGVSFVYIQLIIAKPISYGILVQSKKQCSKRLGISMAISPVRMNLCKIWHYQLLFLPNISRSLLPHDSFLVARTNLWAHTSFDILSCFTSPFPARWIFISLL